MVLNSGLRVTALVPPDGLRCLGGVGDLSSLGAVTVSELSLEQADHSLFRIFFFSVGHFANFLWL